MQDFDEMKEPGEMICKRLSKSFKLHNADDTENISDPNAWTVMFPVHKASKFGQISRSATSKQSSKMS